MQEAKVYRNAEEIGIKDKRLEKIFEHILASTHKVMEMIEHSFLSDDGKVAYRKNYEERLKLHLCYSIEQYGFNAKMQQVIDRFL